VNTPPNEPIGVRHALRMTASSTLPSPYDCNSTRSRN
jgi:hypothetical protein